MTTKPPARKRGRPAFQPTAAMRRQVAVAAGGGMRHEDIALALGICRDTLDKYFQNELTAGANMKRMEVLASLHAAAKKGSSAAAKAYLAVAPQFAVPPLPVPVGAPVAEAAPAAAAPKVVKGKKEQQAEDAVTAQQGTSWESLLRPSSPVQ